MSERTEATMGNGHAAEAVSGPPSNPEPAAAPAPPRGERGKRRMTLLVVVCIAAGLLGWRGLPLIHEYFSHVETDDAYVTGHPTSVGSRITDVVEEVLVDDNDFVEKGALLVRLDRQPIQVQVDQKRAELKHELYKFDQLVKTLENDRANLEQARDMVGVALAGLDEAWKGIESKQDQVRYRIASLKAAAANMRSAQADVTLAQKDYERVDRLVAKQSATQAELDQRWATLQGAREKLKASEQQVQQARVQLTLAPDYKEPEKIPADLERSDTEVRRSVAAGQQVLAQLGIRFGKGLDPMVFHQVVSGLIARPAGWIDQIPSVRSAKAKVDETLASLGGPSFDASRPHDHPPVMRVQKELDEAELRLSYTEIRAPISGFLNRRAVNPGDHVQAGQALFAIQPLESVYIVANFKETQLADLQIGQPVEIYVDAYPKRPMRGRISGFAPATGAASSLLPPENATGNFVKVVQRLPVRIDLVEPNPRDTPLFVGMSVIPAVSLEGKPTGPDAGERLRSITPRATTAKGEKMALGEIR